MNTKMLVYILKRLGLAILTVWVVITVTFFVMHAVPGGPFLSEKAVTEAAQKALEAKYGLDKPLFEQYITYLRDIVTRFDFGPSLKLRGRQVIDIIGDGMKTSAKLGIIAACTSLIIGVVLGAVAALRRNKFIDKFIMVLTTAFVSMPSFIMGSLLLVIFAIALSVLPANGSTFHNERARYNISKHRPKVGYDRDECILQRMAEYDPHSRNALSTRGTDIILIQLLDHGGAHQSGNKRHRKHRCYKNGTDISCPRLYAKCRNQSQYFTKQKQIQCCKHKARNGRSQCGQHHDRHGSHRLFRD